MYRYIKSSVQPAVTQGTTFYRVTLESVIDHFADKSENVWMYKLFSDLGWGALDFGGNLSGSFIKDDDLFICVTDGTRVRYKNKFVDPYKLPRNVDIAELNKYVSTGNDKIIHRYITPYEVITPNFSEWSDELLAEGYKEKKLLQDAKQFKEL